MHRLRHLQCHVLQLEQCTGDGGIAGDVRRLHAGDGIAGEARRAGIAEHEAPGELAGEFGVEREWT